MSFDFDQMVDQIADAIAERALEKINERIQGGMRNGAARSQSIEVRRNGIVKKRDMSCRYAGCKNRSKGPRFRFLCVEHLKLPKKKQDEVLAKWAEKNA